MTFKPAFGSVLAAWLILGGGVAIWLVWNGWNTKPEDRELELLKFGLELFQAVVVGSIAALLLEWFKRIQDSRAATTERREEWSRSARKAYDDIKKRRRLLQDRLGKGTPSAGACGQAHNQLVEHGEQMIASQLLLEDLLEQVEDSTNAEEQATAPHLSQMESNLNKLSDSLRSQNRSNGDIQRIGEFLDRDTFKRDFGHPYHQARSIFLQRR